MSFPYYKTFLDKHFMDLTTLPFVLALTFVLIIYRNYVISVKINVSFPMSSCLQVGVSRVETPASVNKLGGRGRDMDRCC